MKEKPNKEDNALGRPKVRCSNCFVCQKYSSLCPLNENYDPDAYLEWEKKYFQQRKDNQGKA